LGACGGGGMGSPSTQYLARLLAAVAAHPNCLAVKVGPTFHFAALADAAAVAEVGLLSDPAAAKNISRPRSDTAQLQQIDAWPFYFCFAVFSADWYLKLHPIAFRVSFFNFFFVIV
jgi:hypothetical protein